MERAAFLPKSPEKGPSSFQVIDNVTDKSFGFVCSVFEASD